MQIVTTGIRAAQIHAPVTIVITMQQSRGQVALTATRALKATTVLGTHIHPVTLARISASAWQLRIARKTPARRGLMLIAQVQTARKQGHAQVIPATQTSAYRQQRLKLARKAVGLTIVTHYQMLIASMATL